jgi:hypothetical protein
MRKNLSWRARRAKMDPSHLDKLMERAQKLETTEVFEALETSCGTLMAYLPLYRQQADAREDILKEMKMSAEACYSFSQLLLDRHLRTEEVMDAIAPARQSRRTY